MVDFRVVQGFGLWGVDPARIPVDFVFRQYLLVSFLLGSEMGEYSLRPQKCQEPKPYFCWIVGTSVFVVVSTVACPLMSKAVTMLTIC